MLDADQHTHKCPIMSWFTGHDDVKKSIKESGTHDSPFFDYQQPESLEVVEWGA